MYWIRYKKMRKKKKAVYIEYDYEAAYKKTLAEIGRAHV